VLRCASSGVLRGGAMRSLLYFGWMFPSPSRFFCGGKSTLRTGLISFRPFRPVGVVGTFPLGRCPRLVYCAPLVRAYASPVRITTLCTASIHKFTLENDGLFWGGWQFPVASILGLALRFISSLAILENIRKSHYLRFRLSSVLGRNSCIVRR